MNKMESIAEERWRKSNESKVMKAKVSLIMAGLFFLIFGVFSGSAISGILGTIAIVLSLAIIGLGIRSIQHPVPSFKFAIIPLAMLTLLFLSLFTMVIGLWVGRNLYHGIVSGNEIVKSTPISADDILDSEQIF